MLLDDDERVLLAARRHGVVLARPFAKALILLGASAGASLLGGTAALAAAAALAGLGAVVAGRAAWRWERTQVIVTDARLLVVHGTLRRRAAAVGLRGAGPVEVEQSLLGRLLGYGTVVAGELEIPCVPEPRRVAGLLARLSG